MKVTQMPPVHAANLVAHSGNTAYGVGVIVILGHPSNFKVTRAEKSMIWIQF